MRVLSETTDAAVSPGVAAISNEIAASLAFGTVLAMTVCTKHVGGLDRRR